MISVYSMVFCQISFFSVCIQVFVSHVWFHVCFHNTIDMSLYGLLLLYLKVHACQQVKPNYCLMIRGTRQYQNRLHLS